MTAVRCWCSLNAWNGVVLTLDEQKVRLYWFVLEFETVIVVRCNMRSNLTRICCPRLMATTTVHWCSLNAWNGVVLTHAPWTNRMYVCIGLCLNSKLSLLFDAIWGIIALGRTVRTHNNGNDGFVIMFVECIWNGVVLTPTGRIESKFLLIRAWIWSCYWCSMQYAVVMSAWRRAVRIHNINDDGCALILAECMGRRCVVLTLDEQVVRLYWCVLA